MKLIIGTISSIIEEEIQGEKKYKYRVNFEEGRIVSGELTPLNNSKFKIDDTVLCSFDYRGDGYILGKV